ncbi:hypothetical protein Bpfe_001555, partial [Biomphalaria pfeifferi]
NFCRQTFYNGTLVEPVNELEMRAAKALAKSLVYIEYSKFNSLEFNKNFKRIVRFMMTDLYEFAINLEKKIEVISVPFWETVPADLLVVSSRNW